MKEHKRQNNYLNNFDVKIYYKTVEIKQMYLLRKEHIARKIGISPETPPNTYFYKGIEAGQQRRDFLRNILG